MTAPLLLLALEAEFNDTWWPLYPRKLAKRAAFKAYCSARRRGRTAEELVAGLKRYLLEINGKEAQYVKHPATWLNGDCFSDGISGVETLGGRIEHQSARAARPAYRTPAEFNDPEYTSPKRSAQEILAERRKPMPIELREKVG